MKLTFAVLSIAMVGAGCSRTDSEGSNKNNCVGACDVGLDDADARDLFAPAAPGDWTQFRADPYRTGYGAESVVGDEVEVVWSKARFMLREYSAVKSSGAVWGDYLYYPSDWGVMYAFDRHTGEEQWRVELIDRNPGIHSSPAVTEKTVLIGTYAGDLHCLDRQTGEEIWRYKIGNVIGSSPLYVEEDNAIYVSHEIPKRDPFPGGGYVTKNDPRDGSEIWVSDQLKHWPHASVAVHPELDIVMVGANDGVLHGYDTNSGEELWSHDFEAVFSGEADIKTTAAMSQSRGIGVLGTWDQHVYGIELESGDILWQFDTGAMIQGSPALDDENGRVFQGASGSGDTFFALDVETGERLWSIAAGRVSSSPAISGNRERVVFGSQDEKVIAVEAATGEIVWEFPTDGGVTASPILVGDMIYVAARLGSLYALRTF